jgi:hypothetical protein
MEPWGNLGPLFSCIVCCIALMVCFLFKPEPVATLYLTTGSGSTAWEMVE